MSRNKDIQREIVARRKRNNRARRASRPINEWRPPLQTEFRRVKRIWDKATCFILGGGPSLADFNMRQLNGAHVVCVNNSYRLAYWSEVLFFGDCWWFEAQRKALENFSGYIYTTCQYDVNLPRRVHQVRHNLYEFGLSGNPHRLTWNMNAGACAVNLALHLGARRVVLLGYDMKQVDGRNNWHDEHLTSRDPSHNPYDEFLLAWPYIAEDAERFGLEIFNATPGSRITEFPVVDIDEFLRSEYVFESCVRT